MSHSIQIKARVVEFMANAMRHHFHAAACHAYDASFLEIIEPAELTGTILPIYHDQKSNIDNRWRQTGAIVEFNISRELLDKSDAIFTGAAQDLRFLSSI